MDGWPAAILCVGAACVLLAAPGSVPAAEPVHSGHYLVSTTQAWLDGRRPEGVIHVARDGSSLVVHSGIQVSAWCDWAGDRDEIRVDGDARRRRERDVVSYHVTRVTPDGRDLIDFAGPFVTRRRFEGVLRVHFGGSPTIGPPCPTPWLGVTAWYARHSWRRYACVNH